MVDFWGGGGSVGGVRLIGWACPQEGAWGRGWGDRRWVLWGRRRVVSVRLFAVAWWAKRAASMLGAREAGAERAGRRLALFAPAQRKANGWLYMLCHVPRPAAAVAWCAKRVLCRAVDALRAACCRWRTTGWCRTFSRRCRSWRRRSKSSRPRHSDCLGVVCL